MEKVTERSAPWLAIAERLIALHEFVYGAGGPLAHASESPVKPTCLEAAVAIRKKFEPGWHWRNEGWLVATASDALRSLNHVIGDGGGRYDETEAGRKMIEMIEQLRVEFTAASSK